MSHTSIQDNKKIAFKAIFTFNVRLHGLDFLGSSIRYVPLVLLFMENSIILKFSAWFGNM